MHILVVENYEGTDLGLLGRALAEAGASLDVRRPYLGDPLPETHDDHDALAVMGGEQSAVSDADYPHLLPLTRLMRAFGDADKSVLGICLGSQLLARAYGGENRVGGHREFGWCPVTLLPAGQEDPVLSAAGDCFRIFEWHDDSFTLPEGAVHLATGSIDNQAFRIGRAAYGTQFHFEAGLDVVDAWRTRSAATIADKAPGWLEHYDDEVRAHAGDAERAGLALARAWIGTIRPRAGGAAAARKQAENDATTTG
ncbi:type 1 glutamine amidotransferase [Rhizobium sp. SG2393]|uniref:type 1 glutamine amidotransferase n=1 Tax=Rhizobium sp. SG2393 TaxID=3276279 RepID=UPI00367017CE